MQSPIRKAVFLPAKNEPVEFFLGAPQELLPRPSEGDKVDKIRERVNSHSGGDGFYKKRWENLF